MITIPLEHCDRMFQGLIRTARFSSILAVTHPRDAGRLLELPLCGVHVRKLQNVQTRRPRSFLVSQKLSPWLPDATRRPAHRRTPGNLGSGLYGLPGRPAVDAKPALEPISTGDAARALRDRSPVGHRRRVNVSGEGVRMQLELGVLTVIAGVAVRRTQHPHSLNPQA